MGTPGFTLDKFQKFKNRFSKSSWYKKLNSVAAFNFIMSATLTFQIHGKDYGDFYRFSPAAYKEVFFEGYQNVSVIEIMQPPRIIGLGYKPASV